MMRTNRRGSLYEDFFGLLAGHAIVGSALIVCGLVVKALAHGTPIDQHVFLKEANPPNRLFCGDCKRLGIEALDTKGERVVVVAP